MKKLVIDHDKCIGCGTCVALAPKTFVLDEEGKGKVVNETGDSLEKIQEAIDACPVQVISWREE